MQRQFEFVYGTSNKFWNITVTDNKVVVQYGRRGTSGRSSTKVFDSSAAANAYAALKIREKLLKRYVEVTSKVRAQGKKIEVPTEVPTKVPTKAPARIVLPRATGAIQKKLQLLKPGQKSLQTPQLLPASTESTNKSRRKVVI